MGEHPGSFLAIVGPSGAGKDTLLDWLRQRFAHEPRVLFARRTVTRKADEASEDHDCLDGPSFIAAEKAGCFCVTWEAHGLHYGLPTSLLDHIASGGVVVANGSRGAVEDIGRVFPGATIVNLVVERTELARRLKARGRETRDAIEARLDRAEVLASGLDDTVLTIDNSGPIAQAGEKVASLIAKALDT